MSDLLKCDSNVKVNNLIPCEEVVESSDKLDINDDKRNDSQKLLNKTFICSVKDCGKEYRKKFSFKRHLTRRHSDKTLRCDHSECNYMTADKDYMKQHQIIHSDERPFICFTDGCEKRFKSKSYLRKHQNTHISHLLLCTEEGCHQICKNKIYLKQHIEDKHSSTPKSFVCRACGKCFESRGKRQYHQRVHQKTIICQIEDCNQTFISRYFYRRHVWRCHSGKEFRCDNVTEKKEKQQYNCKFNGCNDAFKSRDKYEVHLRTSHKNDTFSCSHPNCNFITHDKQNLKSHLKTHLDERPFVCDIYGCGKAFKARAGLKKHRSRHFHRLMVCPYYECYMIFVGHKMLKQHIDKIHLQITRRYSCEWPECEFTTDNPSTYYYHRGGHIDQRFTCTHNQCGKSFKSKNYLRVHTRRHRQNENL